MSESAKNTASNRRRALRRSPKSSTRISCHPNALGVGKNLAASLLDLSEFGVRLLVKVNLKPGQEVHIGLEGMGHRRAIRVAGHVAWAVPAADGSCCIGVEFQKPLPYADLLELARL
jgi:hypothetical protein